MRRKTLSALGAVLIFLLLWWAVSLLLDKPFFPAPPAVFRSFAGELAAGVLPRHFGVSAWRVALSLLLGLLLAAPLGMAMGQCRRLDWVLSPLVYLMYPIPKVVFLPVIVVLFGLGDFPKVFLITLVLFFQLLVVTRDASREVRGEYLLSARALGMNRRQCWRHVLIPACLPQIITALRVGLGTAVAILFFAETFASVSGLGYYISDAMSRRSYDRMFAGILAMGLLGLGFYALFWVLERAVSRWKGTK